MNPNPLILISGDSINKLNEGFNSSCVYAISGLQPSFVDIPIYIGSSKEINRRINRGHLYSLNQNDHHNQPLQNYYNKYGKDNIVIFCLEQCSADNLEKLEQEYIDYYGSIHTKQCFNICTKVDRVQPENYTPWSQERKDYYSLIMSGENNPSYGKNHSEKTKTFISQINTGKKHSEKTKEKHKQRMLKYRHSLESKIKIGNSNKGKSRSLEQKKAISIKNAESFSVLDINSGFIYDFVNLREFCQKEQISRATFLETRKQTRRKRCKNWVLMDKNF